MLYFIITLIHLPTILLFETKKNVKCLKKNTSNSNKKYSYHDRSTVKYLGILGTGVLEQKL